MEFFKLIWNDLNDNQIDVSFLKSLTEQLVNGNIAEVSNPFFHLQNKSKKKNPRLLESKISKEIKFKHFFKECERYVGILFVNILLRMHIFESHIVILNKR